MNRKIFSNFLLSYLIVLLIPLIIGIIAYNEALKAVEQDAWEANLSSLQQCRSILDGRLAEVDQVVTQMAFNPKIRALANADSPYEDATNIINIKDAQESIIPYRYTNNFVKDIYIYLNKSNIVISPYYTYLSQTQFYNDYFKYGDMNIKQWTDKILNVRHIKDFYPSTAVITGTITKNSESMILYVQSFPFDSDVKGHIMALISKNEIQKLLGNISIGQGGSSYITDQNGRTLVSFSSEPNQPLNAVNIKFNDKNGYLIQDIAGKRMLISYDISPYNGWHYIAVLPYNVVMYRVQHIKQIIYIILLLALLIGVCSACIMAYQKSKPIKNLLELIKDKMDSLQDEKRQNEYAYLSKSIMNLIDNNKAMKDSLKKQIPLLQVTFLEKLLKDGFNNLDEIKWFLDQLGFKMLNGGISVLILKVNIQPSSIHNSTLSEIGAVKVIVREEFSKYHRRDFHYYDLDFEKSVFIFDYINDEGLSYTTYIENFVNEVSSMIYNSYGISLLFASRDQTCDYMNINRLFDEAMEALEHKYLHKGRNIVWYENIVEQEESYYYPMNTETRLMNFTKLGNIEMIEDIIDRIYQENYEKKRLSSPMSRNLINDMCCTILKTVDIFHGEQNKHIRKHIEDKVNNIGSCTTIDETFTAIINCYRDICNIVNLQKHNKNRRVMDNIMEFISNNYMDPQMSLTLVAEKFNFASAYLSKMFKDYTNENFTTYLEKIRISKACDFLMHGFNVDVVSSKVGYNSVYAFRSAFKRVQGTTPSEYRVESRFQNSI